MNSTTKHASQKRHISREQAQRTRDAEGLLDVLLALDRMVVEVSMQLYNVNRQERSMMRRQNRRLHAAVREHLPRLLKTSRSRS